ncbi:TPA: hypothetical protein UM343_002949 [Stenotrophomonas maltophilia]|nr:hypothetical protein [Stenotrophomonas maltophilia]
MSATGHCDAAFKKAVLLKCYEALEVEGFTRYRMQDVDWPMEHGFHCWVGLNTGLEREYLDINPFVGVHVVPIMKLYTSLEGRKYSRSTSTYAVHMGELAPKEQAFRFTRETDVAAQAARLARLYSDVGLSYALSIGTYERLLPLLQERVPMLGAYPERVASCLYLMGRKEEARLFAEEFLQDHRDYFEGFAVPFLRILNGQ